jgi:hypothetical protein
MRVGMISHYTASTALALVTAMIPALDEIHSDNSFCNSLYMNSFCSDEKGFSNTMQIRNNPLYVAISTQMDCCNLQSERH